jgi:hypothetical protein
VNLTTIPRSAAKLPFLVARLPFGLVEDQVIARYLDDEAPARIGYERFLGSVDRMAGRLLNDDGITRRGQVLVRKTDFLAKAEELDAKAEARRAEADEDLRTRKAAARRDLQDAQREKAEKVAEARADEQKDKERARREASARAEADEKRAEQVAEKRADDAERAEKAKHERIAADEARATDAPKHQLADAADKRSAARDRQNEADRLAQLTDAQRDARRSS